MTPTSDGLRERMRKTMIDIAQRRLRRESRTLDYLRTQPWWPDALTAACENAETGGTPVMPLPYLSATMIVRGGMQDLADLALPLGTASEDDLAHLRSVISRCAPDLSGDIDMMIVIAKLDEELRASAFVPRVRDAKSERRA